MAKTAKARGFGNIRKLPSGKWQVRYTDPNGQSRTARSTFTAKREAEFELSRIRDAIERGNWHVDEAPQSGDLDPKSVTLKQLGDHWRNQRTTTSGQPLSPSTLSEYERYINKVLRSVADKPIRSITTQQIEKWREPEMKRAPNQTVKVYKHLNTLLKWAHKRKWISSNPCDIERASSYKPSEPLTPNSKQVETMLEEAREPFKTFFAIAAWGGLRRGEILELRRKDVEKIEHEGDTFIALNIRRSVLWQGPDALVRPPKTSSGIRRVILSRSASALVQSHLTSVNLDPDALLFTDQPQANLHWGYHRTRPEWQRVCKAANFKGRFHSLRSFAMTQYATQGATLKDLMDRAGHNNVGTAMRYQRESGREIELVRKLG